MLSLLGGLQKFSNFGIDLTSGIYRAVELRNIKNLSHF